VPVVPYNRTVDESTDLNRDRPLSGVRNSNQFGRQDNRQGDIFGRQDNRQDIFGRQDQTSGQSQFNQQDQTRGQDNRQGNVFGRQDIFGRPDESTRQGERFGRQINQFGRDQFGKQNNQDQSGRYNPLGSDGGHDFNSLQGSDQGFVENFKIFESAPRYGIHHNLMFQVSQFYKLCDIIFD
jgi:hypothetical protein